MEAIASRPFTFKGRPIVRGVGVGEALVSSKAISFLGGVDPKTGTVIDETLDINGANVKGKVLIFPNSKGSTVGSYVIYSLKRFGNSPAGFVNREADPVTVVGCAMAKIPLIDRLNHDPISNVKTGVRILVDGFHGILKVLG